MTASGDHELVTAIAGKFLGRHPYNQRVTIGEVAKLVIEMTRIHDAKAAPETVKANRQAATKGSK